MTTYNTTPRPYSSPWGLVDHAEQVGPGVWSVGTPSHSGFILSDERNAKVPACIRDARGQYEEDCEWAAVAWTFPDLFKAADVIHARDSLRHWRPDAFEALTGEKATPENSLQRRRAAQLAAA